mgnify:FL=1
MSGTGFLDGWKEEDTSDVAPPPVKKKKTNVWGEEIKPLPEGHDKMSLEELDKQSVAPPPVKKKPAPTVLAQGFISKEPPVKATSQKDLEEKKINKEFLMNAIPAVKPAITSTFTPPSIADAEDNLTGYGKHLTAVEKARQAQAFMKEQKNHHVFCGIVAPPKAGKSSIVFDSLTDEEAASGAEVWDIDFDGHAHASIMKNYPHRKDNILAINPYVIYKEDGRVPYDFPKTHLNIINILQDALRQVDTQEEYFNQHGKMPERWLKTVMLDGADSFLKICELNMKIADLDLGADAIAVSGKKATTSVGRTNWYIRSNYFMAALDLMKELSRRGVHCYVITHFKADYDSNGNEIKGEGVPHWLPRKTESALTQIIYMTLDEEIDDTGRRTGVVTSTAILKSNGVSLKSSGTVTIYRQDTEGGEWFGWHGLRDGSFSTE